MDVIPEMLANGQIVVLGDVGRLRVSLSSKGEIGPSDVNASSIRGAKILFRPGNKLQDMLKTLSFKKESSS